MRLPAPPTSSYATGPVPRGTAARVAAPPTNAYATRPVPRDRGEVASTADERVRDGASPTWDRGEVASTADERVRDEGQSHVGPRRGSPATADERVRDPTSPTWDRGEVAGHSPMNAYATRPVPRGTAARFGCPASLLRHDGARRGLTADHGEGARHSTARGLRVLVRYTDSRNPHPMSFSLVRKQRHSRDITAIVVENATRSSCSFERTTNHVSRTGSRFVTARTTECGARNDSRHFWLVSRGALHAV